MNSRDWMIATLVLRAPRRRRRDAHLNQLVFDCRFKTKRPPFFFQSIDREFQPKIPGSFTKNKQSYNDTEL